MPISKGKILTISGSVLGLSTGIAATIGQKLLDTGMSGIDAQMLLYGGAAVSGGVAVNLLSNVAHNLCDLFSKRVITIHPDELNHDLQKILLTSVSRSLDNILILYKDKKPSKENIKSAIEFIESVEHELKNLFKSPDSSSGYNIHVQQYMHNPVKEAKLKILSSLQDELNNTDLPVTFITLFKESFIDQFRLCFSEELKDKNNNAAWIAFQKMMLEAMKLDLENILKEQTKIASGIEELKKGQTSQKLVRLSPQKAKAIENLLKEINQPGRIQLQLDKALDDLLGEMKKELGEIRRIGTETHTEVKGLRKVIEQDRKHWWSRKMVIAYVMIIVLVAAVIIVRNYYLGQPFMISVIVHGPKGIGDIVLKNRGTVVMGYGDKTEKQTLNEKGEALFRQIPGRYRDDSSLIIVTDLEGDPYKPVCDKCKYRLEPGKTFYIQLEPYGLDKLNGVVVDEKGKPIPDATVIVQDVKTITDENGSFELNIPQAKQKRLQDITVIKKGYKAETVNQVPPHVQSKLEIQLRKN